MEFWERLGFRENPYNTKPLNVSLQDVDLLMGRNEEQIEFLNAIDSNKEGILVLSGVPGVGKTSFFNVQQFLLESGHAPFGPRLLAARQLCPVNPYDEPRFIAERCVQSLCKSIQVYCSMTGATLPPETKKISEWINKRSAASYSLGLSVMGYGGNFGRQVSVSSIKDTTYEGLVEVIEVMVSEVVAILNFSGCFIVLDNIENLQEDELGESLITFRDTLFSLENVWWILIGQAGLNSLIQTKDPRVSQRISASIDLKPISDESLKRAVDQRVDKFHSGQEKGSSPIPESIYTRLFESSNGEIRFVFKYCHDICLRLVKKVRTQMAGLDNGWGEKVFNELMGNYFVKNEISEDNCNGLLKELISENFHGLNLSEEIKGILKQIGKNESVGVSDYKDFKKFGVKNQNDFLHNYLTKLKDKNLLLRKTEGKVVKFQLRGLTLIALEKKLL
ncbi:hypothetical protein MKO06_15545 [Gramella sp. GC03-9]|uniref:Uncharacterized protein n=1 Tax=Christiangramia oceanisediminis TaxID=2920386 RepID=A0A9X2RAE3_9FLAO|nr:hypothetical protein [Gramella oceanisediminis]MCP9201323.1 hypothetical protein [Gramella oceanisediminis]